MSTWAIKIFGQPESDGSSHRDFLFLRVGSTDEVEEPCKSLGVSCAVVDEDVNTLGRHPPRQNTDEVSDLFS